MSLWVASVAVRIGGTMSGDIWRRWEKESGYAAKSLVVFEVLLVVAEENAV